jgi:site-specific recombinase XerD
MDSSTSLEKSSQQLPVLVSREELTRRTADFFTKGIEGSENTRKAYLSDIKQLEQWLRHRELPSLPIGPAALAAYISDQAADRKWSTISRRLAAIRQWHRLHKHPNPAADEVVQIVMEGIKRTLGTEPEQCAAFDIEEYKACLALIPATPTGLRDRALLLAGFAGGFRRSELVALNIEGVKFTREGAVLTYRGSKTNQYKKIEEKALFFSPDPATCPVRAMQDYLEVLNRETGPLLLDIVAFGF